MNDFTLNVRRSNSAEVEVYLEALPFGIQPTANDAEVTFVVKNNLQDTMPVFTKSNTAAGGNDSQVTVANNGIVVHILPSDVDIRGEFPCAITLSVPSQSFATTWVGAMFVVDHA